MLNSAATASVLLLLSLPAVKSAAKGQEEKTVHPKPCSKLTVYQVDAWSNSAAVINLEAAGTGPLLAYLQKEGSNVEVKLLDNRGVVHHTWTPMGIPALFEDNPVKCCFFNTPKPPKVEKVKTEQADAVNVKPRKATKVFITFCDHKETQAFLHDYTTLENSPDLEIRKFGKKIPEKCMELIADLSFNDDFSKRVPRWNFEISWRAGRTRYVTTDPAHLDFFFANDGYLPLRDGYKEKDVEEGYIGAGKAYMYNEDGIWTLDLRRPVPSNILVKVLTPARGRRLASVTLINRIARESDLGAVPKRRRLGWKPSHDIPRRSYESKLLREHERC